MKIRIEVDEDIQNAKNHKMQLSYRRNSCNTAGA
jgi:hypothetical protein